MARARLLSRSLSTSRKFFQVGQSPLGEFAQLLYTLITPHVDDFGRLAADPVALKLAVHPGSARPFEEFAAALALLAKAQLISLHEHRGRPFLQVRGFDRIEGSRIRRRTVSRWPAPQAARAAKIAPPPVAPSVAPSASLAGKRAALARVHAPHAWCWPHRAGFCVGWPLFEELRGRSLWPDAQLKDWLAATMGALADQVVTDNLYDFWRNSLAAALGPPVTRRAADPVRTILAAVEQRRARQVGEARGPDWEDWFVDCRARHEGACLGQGGRVTHELRCQAEDGAASAHAASG